MKPLQPPTNKRQGYVRGRSAGKDIERRTKALKLAGCVDICVEIAPAGNKLPKLQSLIAGMRPGDMLVVADLESLAVSREQLLRTIPWEICGKGIHLHALAERIDTTTPHGVMFIRACACLFGFKEDPEGRARRRSNNSGRPPVMSPSRIKRAERLLEDPNMTIAAVAERLGVARQTIYRTCDVEGARARSNDPHDKE